LRSVIARLAFLLPLLVAVAACASIPGPTQTFPPIPNDTPTFAAEPQVSPTAKPRPSINPGLHVDGMATVVRDVDQIADPEHPNHAKDNRKFEPLQAGTHVYLVNMLPRRKMNYWQVYDGSRQDGLVGWIPQPSRGDLNIEPYQPECPDEFPLTADSFADFGSGDGSLIACFGETELTLVGEVACDRSIAEYAVSGVSFLDADRSCYLGQRALHLYGNEIFELLEAPPVDSITGRYLVRGHFDDPEAQNCYSIEFGTPLSNSPGEPPEPGAVMACRQMFVVGNVISQN
jgi:hypothetical protein